MNDQKPKLLLNIIMLDIVLSWLNTKQRQKSIQHTTFAGHKKRMQIFVLYAPNKLSLSLRKQFIWVFDQKRF